MKLRYKALLLAAVTVAAYGCGNEEKDRTPASAPVITIESPTTQPTRIGYRPPRFDFRRIPGPEKPTSAPTKVETTLETTVEEAPAAEEAPAPTPEVPRGFRYRTGLAEKVKLATVKFDTANDMYMKGGKTPELYSEVTKAQSNLRSVTEGAAYEHVTEIRENRLSPTVVIARDHEQFALAKGALNSGGAIDKLRGKTVVEGKTQEVTGFDVVAGYDILVYTEPGRNEAVKAAFFNDDTKTAYPLDFSATLLSQMSQFGIQESFAAQAGSLGVEMPSEESADGEGADRTDTPEHLDLRDLEPKEMPMPSEEGPDLLLDE